MVEKVTQQLRYEGPTPLISALAHWLEAEGVEIDYDPPLETRDLNTALAVASVLLAATGNITDIRAGVRKFRERFSRSGAKVAFDMDRDALGERLRKLDDLHREGAITDEERREQRARILREL